MNDLVAAYGIHRTTVMEHLARNGVARRVNVRRLADEDVAVAAQHYAAGESLATVAARFEVSPKTVAREFERAGIPTRPRRGYD